jgi:hypothetical protein
MDWPREDSRGSICNIDNTGARRGCSRDCASFSRNFAAGRMTKQCWDLPRWVTTGKLAANVSTSVLGIDTALSEC